MRRMSFYHGEVMNERNFHKKSLNRKLDERGEASFFVNPKQSRGVLGFSRINEKIKIKNSKGFSIIFLRSRPSQFSVTKRRETKSEKAFTSGD
jgi:hypothetical protein